MLLRLYRLDCDNDSGIYINISSNTKTNTNTTTNLCGYSKLDGRNICVAIPSWMGEKVSTSRLDNREHIFVCKLAVAIAHVHHAMCPNLQWQLCLSKYKYDVPLVIGMFGCALTLHCMHPISQEPWEQIAHTFM